MDAVSEIPEVAGGVAVNPLVEVNTSLAVLPALDEVILPDAKRLRRLRTKQAAPQILEASRSENSIPDDACAKIRFDKTLYFQMHGRMKKVVAGTPAVAS